MEHRLRDGESALWGTTKGEHYLSCLSIILFGDTRASVKGQLFADTSRSGIIKPRKFITKHHAGFLRLLRTQLCKVSTFSGHLGVRWLRSAIASHISRIKCPILDHLQYIQCMPAYQRLTAGEGPRRKRAGSFYPPRWRLVKESAEESVGRLGTALVHLGGWPSCRTRTVVYASRSNGHCPAPAAIVQWIWKKQFQGKGIVFLFFAIAGESPTDKRYITCQIRVSLSCGDNGGRL